MIKALLETDLMALNNADVSPELLVYYDRLVSDYIDLRIDKATQFTDEEDYRDILYLEKRLKDQNIAVNDSVKEIRNYLGEHASDNLKNMENEFSMNNGIGETTIR